jgi:hypothetical protein
MNCRECSAYGRNQPEICTACKEMQQNGEWIWEIDNGQRVCRCPDCGFGNILSLWAYKNPFNYCGGCGKHLSTFEQTKLDI